MNYRPTYNQVYGKPKDITNQSDVIAEPVSLQIMKDYLRLQGFSTDATNIVSEAPLALTLLEAATTVQSALLIDATILTLAREGTIYTKSLAVGNRKFTHNATTGVVAFENTGAPGGEGIDITYGYASATGGDDAFDFDNDLITEMIIASRKRLEEWLGISIVRHTWRVLITNLNGDVEIPMSNNWTIVSLIKYDGTVVDIDDDNTHKGYGEDELYLDYPRCEKMTIEYDAGFEEDEVPEPIRLAIKRDVAYHYENRNDQSVNSISNLAMNTVSSYKKVSTWLA